LVCESNVPVGRHASPDTGILLNMRLVGIALFAVKNSDTPTEVLDFRQIFDSNYLMPGQLAFGRHCFIAVKNSDNSDRSAGLPPDL
jgi:hypothetical protein